MFKPPKISAALVARELKPALKHIPELTIGHGNLNKIRQRLTKLANKNIKRTAQNLRDITCQEQLITNTLDGSQVRVLIYRPAHRLQQSPVAMHLHGGGFIMGSPELNDSHNRAMVAALGCIVVSVDYRLAPEHPFPAALYDGYSVLAWLNKHAQQLAIDVDRIAIVGESAGAGLAASLAQYTRDQGEYNIQFLLLDAPMLDDKTGSDNSNTHPYCGEYSWRPANNAFAWQCYLSGQAKTDCSTDYAAAARSRNLNKLPTTFMVVGALDLFLPEVLAYANGLISAGVSVELHVIPGAFHAYSAAGPEAPQVQQTEQLKYAAMARALGIAPSNELSNKD